MEPFEKHVLTLLAISHSPSPNNTEDTCTCRYKDTCTCIAHVPFVTVSSPLNFRDTV